LLAQFKILAFFPVGAMDVQWQAMKIKRLNSGLENKTYLPMKNFIF
jgi:hypothetical protein